MAFAAARMILKDKRRKSKEDFVPPRQRSKVDALTKHMFPFLTFLPHCFNHAHKYIPFVFPNKTDDDVYDVKKYVFEFVDDDDDDEGKASDIKTGRYS